MPPEAGDGDDGDAWDGRGLGEADEQEDPYRLPVTSEIALEGKVSHTCSASCVQQKSQVAVLNPRHGHRQGLRAQLTARQRLAG